MEASRSRLGHGREEASALSCLAVERWGRQRRRDTQTESVGILGKTPE